MYIYPVKWNRPKLVQDEPPTIVREGQGSPELPREDIEKKPNIIACILRGGGGFSRNP